MVHGLAMNAHTKSPRTAALFKSNRSQAVRIPKDLEFPEGVKKVVVRKEGNSLVIAPAGDFWDTFFDAGPNLSFPERFPQGEYEERESL
jgi:antitoxin VapB